jgi:hypothetical protein
MQSGGLCDPLGETVQGWPGIRVLPGTGDGRYCKVREAVRGWSA